jgi:biopolymer transport protein TolQ
MTVTQDLSFVELVIHASLLVQLVMALLLTVSLVSWTYIFRKMFAVRTASRQTEEFERNFWAGGNLNTLYESAASNRRHSSGKIGALERIFESGMSEFNKIRASLGNRGASDPSGMIDGARRAMRAAYQREMDVLESHLSFLASVGSVSPYVGLFGTVWGIMGAFQGLGEMKDVTIAVVAPHISEALIATAMGLFAAIPAQWAYNRYATKVERIASRYDVFQEEFSSVLQRQIQTDDVA